jgi:hypothetical protein
VGGVVSTRLNITNGGIYDYSNPLPFTVTLDAAGLQGLTVKPSAGSPAGVCPQPAASHTAMCISHSHVPTAMCISRSHVSCTQPCATHTTLPVACCHGSVGSAHVEALTMNRCWCAHVLHLTLFISISDTSHISHASRTYMGHCLRAHCAARCCD